MDLALLTIAGISLLLAIAMGIALLHVLRERRARADARVALLRAVASAELPAEREGRPAAGCEGTAALEGSHPIAGTLFGGNDLPSPLWRRAGIAAAILLVLAGGYRMLAGDAALSGPSVDTPRDAPPLELVELAHAIAPGSLTITGTVQNPHSSPARSRVVATATVYGDDGTVSGSARAGLDRSRLAAGGGSAFVINVPLSGGVSRYRVGFRSLDGAVIAHVDRRATPAAAQRQRTTGGGPWVP